jgi:uncharacterized membrane protein YhfC
MNSVLYFTYPLSAILIFILAIGLGFFLTHKYKLGWRLYWIGAVLFIISQLFHIPFNILVSTLFRRGFLPTPPANYQLLFNAVFLGLSAGLFEELTRYAGLRWWAKDVRSWAKGLLFGSGWGGIEAILVGGLILLAYINFVSLRTQDLTTLVPPEQLAALQGQVNAYWSVAWYYSMLGAVERLLTIPFQIAMTILVLQVFVRGQSRWLWIAIGLHTLVDAVAVYSLPQWGAYVTEGIVAIFTLLSLGIIFTLRSEEPELPVEEITADGPIDLGKLELAPIEENLDNIEGTRYTD